MKVFNLLNDAMANIQEFLDDYKKKEKIMEEKEYQDQIEGRNAVLELLESGRDINKILVAKGEKHRLNTQNIRYGKRK